MLVNRSKFAAKVTLMVVLMNLPSAAGLLAQDRVAPMAQALTQSSIDRLEVAEEAFLSSSEAEPADQMEFGVEQPYLSPDEREIAASASSGPLSPDEAETQAPSQARTQEDTREPAEAGPQPRISPDLREDAPLPNTGLSSAPDLTRINPTINQTTVNPGDTLSLGLTVKNQGAASSGSSYVYYYWKKDSRSYTSTYKVGQDYFGSLSAGGTSNESFSFTVPSSATAGTYYLYYWVDAPENVAESDETNNKFFRTITVVSLPDLTRINPTINQTTVNPGDTLSLGLTVKNQGAASSGSSYVYYYWKKDSRSYTSTYKVGEDYFGSLSAGGTSNESFSFTVPSSATAGTYYLYYWVDAPENVAESDETNNKFFRTITVVSLPDLTRINPTINQTTVNPGDTLSLGLTVKNQGAASSGSSYVYYYWKKDSRSYTSTYKVGEDYFGSLSAGGTSNESFSFTVPSSATAGTYYLYYWVDAPETVAESDEDNNQFFRTITVVSLPDLTRINPTINQTTVNPGDTLSLGLTVKNQGAASSGSSYVYYYWKKDSRSYTSTYKVGEDYFGSLSAGGTSNESFSFTVPSSATAGTYYLYYWVDAPETVAESDEDNNQFFRTITVVSLPDLTRINPTINQTTVNPGDTLSLGLTVKNQGAASSGSSYVYYYWKKDSRSYTSTYKVGEDYFGSLSAGGTSNESFSFTVPSSATPGTYYLYYWVDAPETVAESDEDNNQFFRTITVVSLPDLTRINPTINQTTVNPGDTLSLGLTVKNQGAASSGSSYVYYYWKKDSRSYTSTYKVGEDYFGSLSAGGTSNESFSFTVPSSATPGTYYLYYWVDAPETVAESVENNNKFFREITVGDVGLGNLTRQSGQSSLSVTGTTVDVSIRVINAGAGSTSSNEVGYYLSADDSLSTTADYLIGTDSVPALSPGATSLESIQVDVTTVSPAVPAGLYYVIYYIDRNQQVAESDETDNAWYFNSTQVNVPSPGTRPGSFSLAASASCASGGNASVELSWGAASGATGYVVYRNDLLLQGALGAGQRSYEDSAVAAGDSWTYSIRASNSYGVRNSNDVTVAIPTGGCAVLDHFEFSNSISSPQTVDVPFQVTVSARDAGGNLVPFTSRVNLGASVGDIDPAYVYLLGGIKTFDVELDSEGQNTVLTASAAGKSASSNAFEMVGGPHSTGDLYGLVRDGDGLRVIDATVSLKRNGAAQGTATTNSVGWYLFEDILCGTYTVSASTSEGLSSEEPSVTVPCPGTASRHLIVLEDDCDPQGVTPVLFVPGILGSAVETVRWKYPLLPKGAILWDSPQWSGVGDDSSRALPGIHGAKTVGWTDLADRLEDANLGYKRRCTILSVPYDWRLPLADVVEDFLKPAIDHALAISPAQGKVHVVAHSMGGLVTRQYIQGSGYRDDIDKFVMAGTPNLGSALAYYIWQGGDPKAADNARGKKFYAPTAEAAYEDHNNKKVTDRDKDHAAYQREMQGFLHEELRSLRDLLPTWNALRRGLFSTSALTCPPVATWQNKTLMELNDSSTLDRMDEADGSSSKVRTRLFASSDLSTIQRIVVGERRCTNQTTDNYPDGIPTGSVDTTLGDGTVTVDSVRGGTSSDTNAIGNIATFGSPDSSAGPHSELLEAFEEEICEFLLSAVACGESSASTIAALQTPESPALSVSIVGRPQLRVRDPLGAYAGVDPVTGTVAEEIPGSSLAMAVDSGRVSVTDPSSGLWEVTLHGVYPEQYQILVYLEGAGLQSSIVADGFFDAQEALQIAVDPAAPTPLRFIGRPGEPEGLAATPVDGAVPMTRLTWLASSDPTVVGYEVFSRPVSGPNFALLATTGDVVYEPGHLWAVGATETERIYVVAAVTASGERSFLSRQALNNDWDQDGLSDIEEAGLGTDPRSSDSDGDGLRDVEEIVRSTDPLSTDTDGDGSSDFIEVIAGTDPLDASSTPAACQSAVALHRLVVDRTQTIEAGSRIDIGDALRVTSAGSLILRSGETVAFADGFSLEPGGELEVVVDAGLQCP